MNSRTSFWNRLSTRLILLFLALAIISLTLVGYLSYENSRQAIEENVFNHLIATNLLKTNQFERWIRTNENDLEFLAQRPLVRQNAAVLSACSLRGDSCEEVAEPLLSDHFSPAVEGSEGISKIALFRATDGLVLMATDPDLVGKYREIENYFQEGLNHTYTGDVTYSISHGEAVMHVSTPLFGPDGTVVAVLASHANLAEMSDIIETSNPSIATEDTYLVNQFNFFVTEPRFGNNFALQTSARTEGIEACLKGNTDFGLYEDYRGIPVLGAYQWIPERRVCILTEVDEAEAYAPILALRNRIMLLGLFVALAAALVSVFFTRSITQPISELVYGADQIGQGNLDYQVETRASEEISKLATSFNNMAANLQRTQSENQRMLEEMKDFNAELESRVQERTAELKTAQTATMNMMMDIAEAKQKADLANLALNQEKAFIDQIINSIPGIFYVFDAEGKFIRWNENFSTVSEYSDEEIAQLHPIQLFRGPDQAQVAERIQKTFEDGESDVEAAFTTKSGRQIPYYFTGYRTMIEEAPYLIGTGFDITDRKQAEEKLRLSEEKFKTISDTSPLAIYRSTGIEQKGDYVNETFTSLFGYTLEEVPSVAEWWPKAYPDEEYRQQVSEEWQRKVEKAIATKSEIEPMEVVVTSKDGSKKYISWSYISFGDQNLAYGLDLTDRKQAEEKLHASEERYRLLAETSPDMIFVIDSDDRVQYVNHQAAKQFGKSPEAVIGKARSALFPPNVVENQTHGLKHVLESGELLSSESPISFPGGEIWLDTQLVPIRTEAGEVNAVMGVSRDITERKQSEVKLQKLLDDLSTSNAELERFAYVASHDLQEPLRMVASYLQLLERRYRDKLDDDAREFIDYAVDGATRMKVLINDLLAYSRVGTRGNPFQPTDFNSVLEIVKNNLKIAIDENNALITCNPLPTLRVDENQLVQVFQNLISNAIKFHGEDSPTIHISVENRDDVVQFSVSDNGIGIDSQYFERIFVIFQRLHNKNKYSGTGIGLAISKRIVERHGGRIWLESQPGEGTTFYFTISAQLPEAEDHEE